MELFDIDQLEEDLRELVANPDPVSTRMIGTKWVFTIEKFRDRTLVRDRDAFEDVLEHGRELVKHAIINYGAPGDPYPVVMNQEPKQPSEVENLLKVIEDREHDISCLDSENVQYRDRVADLEDTITDLRAQLKQ